MHEPQSSPSNVPKAPDSSDWTTPPPAFESVHAPSSLEVGRLSTRPLHGQFGNDQEAGETQLPHLGTVSPSAWLVTPLCGFHR